MFVHMTLESNLIAANEHLRTKNATYQVPWGTAGAAEQTALLHWNKKT